MARQIEPRVHECIDRCQSCQDLCLETVNHCLALGGRHADAEHIRMLLACAKDCDRFGDDELMRRCADMCRRCAESCREMAVAGVR